MVNWYAQQWLTANSLTNYVTGNATWATTNTNTTSYTMTLPYTLTQYVTATTDYEWFINDMITQRTGDGDVVMIPAEATISELAWEAWIAENVAESALRQAAREAYNQAQQERVRQAALNATLRQAADDRAQALLFEHLDATQRRSWIDHKRFDAEINGETYRFIPGTHGNVSRLRGGQAVERFCIAPVAPHDGGMLPVDDVVLAQLLLLRTCEAEFRRVANVTRLAA